MAIGNEAAICLDQQILTELRADFIEFIEFKDNESFTGFRKSTYIEGQENYKYSVYEQTRNALKHKSWVKEDIGTGKIQKCVADALKRRIRHDGRSVNNNLTDWRKQDDFSRQRKDNALEEALFRFYKSSDIKPKDAFDAFIREELPYQVIAYLFFIKDMKKFMPISQQRFDSIFIELGIPNFKTDRNRSWDNYATFNRIIEEVRAFLLPTFPDTTLLDAHSFLWIIGSQMKDENFVSSRLFTQPTTTTTTLHQEGILTGKVNDSLPAEENDDQEYYEGSEIFQLHRKKERSKALIKAAKTQRIKTDPKLCCEVCGFSFLEKYGELGQHFIEAHHLTPISELTEEKATTISELALVCANCHRMLHRKNAPTLDKLKSLIGQSLRDYKSND